MGVGFLINPIPLFDFFIIASHITLGFRGWCHCYQHETAHQWHFAWGQECRKPILQYDEDVCCNYPEQRIRRQ